MGALDLPTLWLPQDDILLKNSIEAGASLESLVRGAVEFSRKFTMKELQDRWHSLLYDLDVSEEACARMAAYELSALLSKSKKVDNSRENKLGDAKRKHESIRRCYYAMRKRVCDGLHYQGDLIFLLDGSFTNGDGDHAVGDPLEHDFGLEGCNFDGLYNVTASILGDEFVTGQENMLEDPMDQNTVMNDRMPNMIGDPCPSEEISGHKLIEGNNIEAKAACNSTDDARFFDCGTSHEHLGHPSSLPEMAASNTVENMLLPKMVNDVSGRGHEMGQFDLDDAIDVVEGILENSDIHLPSVLTNHMTNDMLFDNFQTSTGCPDDYFASLDFKFANEDEMHMHSNGEGSDGIDDPCHSGVETFLLEVCNMPENNKPASVVAADSGTIPVRSCVAESFKSESNFQSCSVNQVSISAPTFDLRFPEYRNGVICCILNTEDSEIPCNDDVVFPSKKPAYGHKRTQNKAMVPSSSAKDITSTQATVKVKKSHSTQNLAAGLNCAADVFGVEIETQGYGGLRQKTAAIKKEYPDLPGCDVTAIAGQIAESNHVQMNVGAMNQESHQMQPAPIFAAPMLSEADEELLSSENEELFSDSDTDIPSFSDVESMILKMDLGPADQEAYCAAKVEKYLQEDALREIIRLEQNADSYMQRDMTLHGAIAVLYGRYSKHYIKKPEILLGRATDGVKVDIDLTREGCAMKISRRQALLKMDKNGTFNLKNMGRCPIYVNSEEISPGQRLDLSSNCLIEIRGMPFIFQVNQQRVKLYLDNDVR